jgi:predicted PurR-regulated permease PerM
MPRWVYRLLLLVVLTYFAASLAFAAFLALRHILVWLITALFLSFALEPAVNWLVAHGWRRGSATGLVLLGLALLGLVIVAAMVPLVIDQVRELIDKVPGWLDRISVYTERWFDVELTGTKILDAIANAEEDVGKIASNLASVGQFILGLIFQMLTIGLFTFYLVADAPRFRRAVCSVLPPRRQHEVLAAWEVAVDKTGGYLYSRLLLAAISASFAFIVLQVLGVPFALPLALFLGLVSQFIPVVGTYIAAAVPLLVALLESPWSALIFLVYVVVYPHDVPASRGRLPGRARGRLDLGPARRVHGAARGRDHPGDRLHLPEAPRGGGVRAHARDAPGGCGEGGGRGGPRSRDTPGE